MHKGLLLLACVLSLDLAVAPAAVPAAPAEAPAAPDSAATAAPAHPLSPMMAAIQAALEEGQTLVAALGANLAAADDDSRAFALQRQIEQAKIDTELRVLRIQLDFARREGRLETAAQLEAVIEQIEHPSVQTVPSERSAPVQGAGAR